MSNPERESPDWRTALVQGSRPDPASGRRFVNPPVVRGSTVLHPSTQDRFSASGEYLEQSLIYGIEGTPTHFALEDMVAAIEGGSRCQIVSTGLNAVAVGLLAYARSGSHLLVPDNVYGPTRSFCDRMLSALGVETTYYPPTASADSLAAYFRQETAALFVESPGSHTFEVQDVPALAKAARARGVPVLMDNTWGIHYFQPFRHGVDVSIQALTKYVGGHSDILLGAVTVNDDRSWMRIRNTAMLLGAYASSDDCWLALRGARTLAVRLDQQMQAGLVVARWFAERREVAEVRHPALPGAPGHDLWRRDFSGAPSLFGVVFRQNIPQKIITAMVDSLRLFGIGASWGGYESLVLPSFRVKRSGRDGIVDRAVRFHIGLEDTADLLADLAQGFQVFE